MLRREQLGQEYWGACAAFLHDRPGQALQVSRDPAAGRPIYWAPVGRGFTAIFTHVSDYVRCFAACALDEIQLGAFLAHPRMVTPATAIQNVRELLAGQRLTIGRDGRSVVDCFWRPAPSGPEFKLNEATAAAAALREAVFDAAAAWQSLETPIAHRLSGGLDSSIVLSALCAARRGAVTCINEFPKDVPEGDERMMARLVAARFGCPLIEVEVDSADVSYRALANAEVSARPSLSDISFADFSVVRAARCAGAVIVSSGQGGDQIFHRARSVGIAVEAVRDRLPLSEAFKVAFDTARLARRPIWDVFGAIWDDCLLRRRTAPYDAAFARVSYASIDARAAAAQSWREHPWWDDIGQAGPARAARIVHLTDLEYYRQPSAVTTSLVSAPVLASLPVLEMVRQIPPYLMTIGGKERGLVRAAFAADLPEEVLRRTQKGSTTRYHNRVFERQLPFIREMLIGGELCRRGLVDATRVERALASDVMPSAPVKSALTVAFVAEMWVRRFLEAKNTSHGDAGGSGASA